MPEQQYFIPHLSEMDTSDHSQPVRVDSTRFRGGCESRQDVRRAFSPPKSHLLRQHFNPGQPSGMIPMRGKPPMSIDRSEEQNESPPPIAGIPPEDLKKAYQAFKKRLKLTRLDDESRLGRGAMSGGGKSSIEAIQPPNQYPKAVWDALVQQGKLRYAGQGMYEIARH
mgnify:CR=1 FL=1